MSLEQTVGCVSFVLQEGGPTLNLKQEDISMPSALGSLRGSWASRLFFSGHGDVIPSPRVSKVLLSQHVMGLEVLSYIK